MADGSVLGLDRDGAPTINMKGRKAKAELCNRDELLLLRAWQTWHEAEAAPGRGLTEEEIGQLETIASSALKQIEGCGGSSPISIAARLHVTLGFSDANDGIEDYPHCVVVGTIRDLLPHLPAEMVAVLEPITKAKNNIYDALGHRHYMLDSRDNEPTPAKDGAAPSVIEAATIRYLRLAKWWNDNSSRVRKSAEKPGGSYEPDGSEEWQPLMNVVLIARASTTKEAVLQAHMLDCLLDQLDCSELPNDLRDDIHAAAVAAHSISLHLETVFAGVLGDLFGPGGIAEPRNRKFGPIFSANGRPLTQTICG